MYVYKDIQNHLTALTIKSIDDLTAKMMPFFIGIKTLFKMHNEQGTKQYKMTGRVK